MTGDQLELCFTVSPVELVRADDPATSRLGAEAVTMRAGSQRARLLAVYGGPFAARHDGLTDDEAAGYAGLLTARSLGYWKRCSDLRRAGLIAPTGELRRSPETGELRQVCAITAAGRAALTGGQA